MTQATHDTIGPRKGAPSLGQATGFLRKRSSRFYTMLFFIYLPTALLFIYLFFFHSPMYVSNTSFALRSGDGSDVPSLAGMFFQNASNTTLDAYIVQSYITSMDMMTKVDKAVNFKSHYSDPQWDVYSRLKANPTREEMLIYWETVVTATYTMEKGIITVEVRAYTPEMAKRISDSILTFSEELVNQMNDRAHQDALRLTRAEVEAAEKRVLQAQEALHIFRDNKSILDPQTTARGLEGVIAKLEAEAASTQAELAGALQVMQPGSPRVQTLETKLLGLQEQIAREKTRLAGLDSSTTTLSSLVGDYTQLVTEEQFAQKQLVNSMGAFETARLKAMSQSRYLVPFQPPTQPQESLYPRPFLFTLIGFLALFIVVGLCSLIIAAVKDHMGV